MAHRPRLALRSYHLTEVEVRFVPDDGATRLERRRGWDCTDLNVLTPHPVYGWMSWVSVMNPTSATMEGLGPLIEGAYARAAEAGSEAAEDRPEV